jgi:elongation factor Ts
MVTTAMVKELREKTGAGIMDAKRALEQNSGDMVKASEFLRQQGLAKAGRKSDRVALQGLIEPYIHGGGRIGAIVEVNCETDFVARTPDFRSLAHDIAMQVAATSPKVVSADQLSAEDLDALTKEYGDRDAAIAAASLLNQVFIKDAKRTIEDLVKEHVAKLGENIVVRRFARFELGADGATDSNGTAPTG